VPDTVAADVRRGLTATPRELSPKLLYDARGSELFDRITTLPEYYPTRCERSILNRYATHICLGMRELVELGSGTASKTRALLYAMAAAGELERYVPFDVDESVVARCANELTELYPGLLVHGVVGDFERDLVQIPAGKRRIVALLGGTIGNLHPPERAAFLARLRGLLRAEDRLVLGTDLVKGRAELLAAYDDGLGVTAEFNRNVLRVLNRSLGANFDPDAFEHVARYDVENSWIEMCLRARSPQRVSIPDAELELELAAGDELRTEISTKFTRERIETELADAGLELIELFTDEDARFALSVAAPR